MEITVLDWVTAGAAAAGAVGAVGAWITTARHSSKVLDEERQGRAITEGFSRLTAAVTYLQSGEPDLALVGVGILKDMRQASWLDDAMRNRAAETLRNYTRSRSTGGGAT